MIEGFWGLGMFGLAKFHRGLGVCLDDFMFVRMRREMEILIHVEGLGGYMV